MSLGSLDDFSADYEALAMTEAEENNVIKWGLPSEVLETMTDYSSPSVNGLPDDIDLWEYYGVDREESSNPAPPQAYGMYSSYLMHEVNDQLYLQEQEQNQVLEDQLVA